jgi:hypothetical protein
MYNISYDGVLAQSAGFIGMEQNEIYNSDYAVELLRVNVGDIDNNEVYANVLGIYFEDSFLEIDNNVFYDNGTGINISASATASSINSNEFCDHLTAAILNNTGSSVNAENNWWGAADGPGGTFGVGSGDSISANVDFDPFETEPLFPNSLCSPTRDCIADGDVNGDGILTPGDSFCAFDIFLNAQTVTPSCDVEDWLCEVIAANVDCGGGLTPVTPGDALAIFDRYLNAGLPEECFDAEEILSAGNVTPRLAMAPVAAPQALKSTGNNTVRYAISASDADNLNAFGLTMNYPSEKLRFVAVQTTDNTADWTKIDGMEVETGKVIIGGFNAEEAAFTSGELIYLVFKVIGEPELTAADFEIAELQDGLAAAEIEISEIAFAGSELIPDNFSLGQNYPNPFNPTTRIQYGIPAIEVGSVATTLSIYNVSGQLIRILVDEEKPAGMYEVEWDGKNSIGVQVPSGTYFYRLDAGDFRHTQKMLLLK